MEQLQLECQMCLRKFAYPAEHKGKLPRNCPECTVRRASRQARQRVGLWRERKRSVPECA